MPTHGRCSALRACAPPAPPKRSPAARAGGDLSVQPTADDDVMIETARPLPEVAKPPIWEGRAARSAEGASTDRGWASKNSCVSSAQVARASFGDLIAGKYRVVCQLGEGGMGVVELAVHEPLGVKVAIKTLNREGRTGADEKRFLLEAQTAAQLKSEHIARVTDVGSLADGRQYMVMEYLEGETLAARLSRRGRLPQAEAVDFIVQACAGLAEAHASGIVHRDIKPSNLFLTRRPDGSNCVKVIDFGISKFDVGVRAPALTNTGLAVGTPLYMSPEQVKHAKSIDGRSDVWALGVVLYELLSGKSPFEDESLGVTLVNILEKSHPAIRDRVTDIDPALAAVIDACLVKDPSGRHDSVVVLADKLGPFGTEDTKRLASRIPKIAERTAARVQVALPQEVAPPPDSGPPGRTPPDGGIASMPTTVQMSLAPRMTPRSDDSLGALHTPSPEVKHTPLPESLVVPPMSRGRGLPIAFVLVSVVAVGAVAWAISSRAGSTNAGPSQGADRSEAPGAATATTSEPSPVIVPGVTASAAEPPKGSAAATETPAASSADVAPMRPAGPPTVVPKQPEPAATATAAESASAKPRTLH
jgi:eukaryotic-like serine/threonine-protein kinase